ncbi:hypothetical protein L2E82_32748 [Cichorium intybus]|uniref:Uncharacterized protein n=1 Tax=Cichorium intybus TaxID=13427 RepID=A0ACB9BHN7_CICIN|nr:hypothetical protein L2E82_32748 [Cichorium intybus]
MLSPPPPPPVTHVSRNGVPDSRTFAAVAAGDCRPPPPPPIIIKPIHLSPAPIMTEWFSGELVYVGTALSMEHLNTLNSEITIGDADGFQLKYLGGKGIKIGIIEYDDMWFPLKSELSNELDEEEDYDEDDDEEGISDTMILDVESDVEEGEILENEEDEEVVEETVLASNDTSGDLSPVAAPVQLDDGNQNSHGMGESQHGESQQSQGDKSPGENSSLNPPIKVYSDPTLDNLNKSNIGPDFGEKFDLLKGCFGPFTFTAGVGHSRPSLGHNLDFEGSYIKRRRIRMGRGSFNNQNVDLPNGEKSISIPPPVASHPPIDLNTSPSASISDRPRPTSAAAPSSRKSRELQKLVDWLGLTS